MTEPTDANDNSVENDKANGNVSAELHKGDETNNDKKTTSFCNTDSDNGKEDRGERNDKSRKRVLGSNDSSRENGRNHLSDKSPGENHEDTNQPNSKKIRTDSTPPQRNSAPVFGNATGFKAFQTGSQNEFSYSTKGADSKSMFGSSTTSSGFVFGKGNTSASNGFGRSAPSTTSIFGTSVAKSSFGKTCAEIDSPKKETTIVTDALPSPVKTNIGLQEPIENIINGEENEETILTLRAKLFKLTTGVKSSAPRVGKDHLGNNSKKIGIQMATKVGEVDPYENTGVFGSNTSDQSHTSDHNKDEPIAKPDWKEIGIGPLRVLQDDNHVRIVQRRENTPGGQGTKLILNIRLGNKYGSLVEKKGDKFIRLAAFEVPPESQEDNQNKSDANDERPQNESKDIKFVPVQYLFKVKTVAEADSLLKTLQKYCKKVRV